MARDAELRARITATDDASKVIDKVADKSEKLEKPVKMTVDADVQAVLGAFDQVTAEAKQTAEAAEVLGRALGPELAAKADTAGIVGDLKNMGLTIDQIKGNADELGAKMREMSDADVGGKLGASLGTTRGQMDELAKSADSSKSVLANMVGNATQDLGALGGIAGSAGVAIGQMGEYMVDAANSGDNLKDVVRNFAAVAGPIAAIAAGIAILTAGVQAYNAPAEAAAERTKELGEAMDEGGDNAANFADVLRDNADALSDFIANANDPLGGFGTWVDEMSSKVPLIGGFFKEAGVDILDASARAGFSLYGLGKQIDGSGLSSEAFAAKLLKAKNAGKITGDEMRAVSEAVDQYGDSAVQAAADAGLLAVSGEEIAGIFEQIGRTEDPLGTFPATFKNIIADLKDGGGVLDTTTLKVNQLSKELGIPPEDVIALAFEEIAKQEEATTKAAEEAADAQRELDEAVTDAGIAMLDAQANSDAFADALDRLNRSSSLDFGQMAQDTVKSFDDVKDALDDIEHKSKIDWSNFDITPDEYSELKGMPEKLAAVTDAVSGMRDSIQTELKAAFDTGGIDAYSKKADFFATEILDQFPAKFEAMGASEEEAQAQTQALLDDLGLLPAEKQIVIQLTREEEARNALEAFSGFIDKLPSSVQIPINTAIAEGDIPKAMTLLNEQLIEHDYPPIVLPVDAEISAAQAKADEAQAYADSLVGTEAIDADRWAAQVAANEAKAYADSLTGTETVDGDPTEAKAAADSAVDYANRQSGAINIDANLRKGSGWDIFSHPFSVNVNANVSGGHSVAPPPTPTPAGGVGVNATAATVPATTGPTVNATADGAAVVIDPGDPLNWKAIREALDAADNADPLNWKGIREALDAADQSDPLNWKGIKEALDASAEADPLNWKGIREALDASGDPLNWKGIREALDAADQSDPLNWKGIKEALDAEADPLNWKGIKEALDAADAADPLHWKAIREALDAGADADPLNWKGIRAALDAEAAAAAGGDPAVAAVADAVEKAVAEPKVDPNTAILTKISETLLDMASWDKTASSQLMSQLMLVLSRRGSGVDPAVRAAAMTIRAGAA